MPDAYAYLFDNKRDDSSVVFTRDTAEPNVGHARKAGYTGAATPLDDLSTVAVRPAG